MALLFFSRFCFVRNRTRDLFIIFRVYIVINDKIFGMILRTPTPRR